MNGGRSHPDDHVTTSEVRQHLAQSERSRDRVVVAGLIQAPGVAEGSKSAPSAMTMMSASKTPESVSTRIASESIDRMVVWTKRNPAGRDPAPLPRAGPVVAVLPLLPALRRVDAESGLLSEGRLGLEAPLGGAVGLRARSGEGPALVGL